MGTTTNRLDILMIGHFSKDRLVIDGRAEIAPGGAIYYGSIPLRRLGIKVGVCTRAHPEDFPLLRPMEEEGVQLFPVAAPETTAIENIYKSTNMERRTCKLLGFAGAYRPEDIPDVEARVYDFASLVAGEVDLPLLEHVSGRGPVAMDAQGFVRIPREGELVFGPWPDMEEGLSHITYLKVDRAEAESMTGETDLESAARKLASYGPKEVLVTESSGVTVLVDGKVYKAPFTPRSLGGRTGRGDTCFSSYLGLRLEKPPEEACRLAAAITTLKQEKPGPWRGTIEEAYKLLDAS